MIDIRDFTEKDVEALRDAISRDKFHPGEWKVEHFWDDPEDKDALNIPKKVVIIEDQKGPISFVRFTKTLRISCVWNDGDDNERNARAIIHGIRDAIVRARSAGFTEIIITTDHPRLATFLEQILKMDHHKGEYVLQV